MPDIIITPPVVIAGTPLPGITLAFTRNNASLVLEEVISGPILDAKTGAIIGGEFLNAPEGDYQAVWTPFNGIGSPTSIVRTVTVSGAQTAPSVIGPPQIFGNTAGQTTTSNVGSASGNPSPTPARMWQYSIDSGPWTDAPWTGEFFNMSEAVIGFRYRLRVTWSNGIGTPAVAYSNEITIVAATAVPGDGMVDQGNGTALFTIAGAPVEIVEPSVYAGIYTVPDGTTPVEAEAVAIGGANRADGDMIVTRALWWKDDAAGNISYKWDILQGSTVIPGGPQSDIGGPTWAFRIPSSLRGDTVTVRETLTQGGVNYFSDSAPFAISAALPRRFIDRPLTSGSANTLSAFTFETGFTYTRIDGGGSSGIAVSAGGAYSSIGSSNKPAFIRNQPMIANQYAGVALQRFDVAGLGEASHISPAVRLSNPTGVQNALTCYRATFQIIGGQGLFRIIKSVNGTETTLQTVQNADFGFDSAEDVVELMLAAEGSTLTMFINGEPMAPVTDTAIANGDIGMVGRGGTSGALVITSFYGDGIND